MYKKGVNSFILVGLERVPKFEEALLLEFGRGFRYTRPLRVNIMDLDYELMEELVSTNQLDRRLSRAFFFPLELHNICFLSLCRTILQRGSAVLCHASVPAPEETEEQLDFQGLRYPMSKKGNIFFDILPLIIPEKNYIRS